MAHDHQHGHGGEHDHTHGAVDPSIATSERGIWAVKWFFAALFVTALLQAVVVMVPGSVALLSDTIHNFGDAATAVLSLSRVLSGNPSPLTALATSFVACRSLPGSLGKLSSASVCRVLLLGAVKVPPIFPKVTRVMSSSC